MWRIGSQTPPSRMMIPCEVAEPADGATVGWPKVVPTGPAALAETAAASSPVTGR